jgi:hypothetical protein
VTDSMTRITHAFRATHTLVMLMGKHTIVAKRAIIFNPENSLIFQFPYLSLTSKAVMNWFDSCIKLVRARGDISVIMNTICNNQIDLLKFCLTLWDFS